MACILAKKSKVILLIKADLGDCLVSGEGILVVASALAGDNAVQIMFKGWKWSKNLSRLWTACTVLAICIRQFLLVF